MICAWCVKIPYQFHLLTIQIYSSHQDLTRIETVLNEELKSISLWLQVNKLSFNVKKDPFHYLKKSKKCYRPIKLLINNQAIGEVNNKKFLRVIIDKKINWKDHINAGKVSRAIGMLVKAQAPLTPSNWSALYRGRGSPVMSCIFLKANNAQQSSGGCAGFNVRLKSYLVLISNFNSTNEQHINLYTWHISHATYNFLLLALTWDLITPNRQSILRDTRTVFFTSARDCESAHWTLVLHIMSIQNKCWVKFGNATCTLQTTFGSNNGDRSGEARQRMWAPRGVNDP